MATLREKQGKLADVEAQVCFNIHLYYVLQFYFGSWLVDATKTPSPFGGGGHREQVMVGDVK